MFQKRLLQFFKRKAAHKMLVKCLSGRSKMATINSPADLASGDKKVKNFFFENIKLKNKCPFIEKGEKHSKITESKLEFCFESSSQVSFTKQLKRLSLN